MAAATYADVVGALAQADERYVVMTAENHAAIRPLPPVLGKRFVDVGICEQTMIGMGAGLALRGRIPIMHALATFLCFRPYEFIRDDLAIPGLPGKLVGYIPGVLSEANGPTHQAIEDVALMRGLPGVKVFSPADLEDMLIGLPAVLEDPSPWYIRYNDRPAAVRHDPTFAIGQAEVIRDGEEIGILVHGALFREALDAAEKLEGEGHSVRLVNLRTVKPLDEAAVLATLSGCRLTVTIEDHFKAGGLYTILAELCLRERLAPAVLPIAFDNKWFVPAMLPDVLRVEGLTGPAIAARILAKLATL